MVKAKVRNRGKVEIDRHGTATATGKAPGLAGKTVANANRWRENYNPLRGLTIKRAVEMLEMGQRGDTALLQWTYRFTEETHPTLSALLTRCESPLLNFDWEIKLKEVLPDLGKRKVKQKVTGPDGAEVEKEVEVDIAKEKAEAQQRDLREAYERIDNLKAAIKHLHLAEFRGYGHLQKHRAEDGTVLHLEPLDQWCVCRDGLYGDWYWNPDSRFVVLPANALGEDNRIGSETLPLEDFIIREVDRPIDRVALINFIRQNLCEKDADGFIEIYGIPGGVVVMPPNVPQGKEGEYESAAKAVAEGGSGAIPAGADYKANDGPRGTDPFTPRLKHLDEQLIMVGTGGKLTMLAESGSGTLAGGAHADTFEEIAEGRAQKISERFQRDFDKEVLDRKHPNEPVLAYFKLGKADADAQEVTAFNRDVIKSLSTHEILARVLSNQTNLKEAVRGAGLPVNEDYTDPYVPVVDSQGVGISGELQTDAQGDVIGAKPAQSETPKANPEQPDPTPEPEPGEPIKNRTARIENRKAGSAPSETLIDNGTDFYAEALASDLDHLRTRLAALDQISNDEILRQRSLELRNDLDAIAKDILPHSKAAKALANVMNAALMTGLTEKPKAKT